MDDQTQPPGDLPPDADNIPDHKTHEQLESGAAPEPRYAMTPDMEAETPEAGAVPPGYDWPTHGGYLGCLLGLLPACLLAGFISSTFIAWPWFNGKGNLPTVVVVALIIIIFAACIYGFARLGWTLGRRFYRKYPQPEPTWGESDNAPSASGISGAAEQDASQDIQGIQGEASGQATP